MNIIAKRIPLFFFAALISACQAEKEEAATEGWIVNGDNQEFTIKGGFALNHVGESQQEGIMMVLTSWEKPGCVSDPETELAIEPGHAFALVFREDPKLMAMVISDCEEDTENGCMVGTYTQNPDARFSFREEDGVVSGRVWVSEPNLLEVSAEYTVPFCE